MNTAATLTIEGQVATITLNRPKAMNSYNLDMAEALLAHTEALSFNDEVSTVLLRGAGNVFMAGGGIEIFCKKLASMPKGIRSIVRTLANTVNNMRQSKQTYLASVHGAVAGAGLSLMLACDLVLAEENTVFTTAYNRLGTSSDGGLSYFLPKLVGDKKAMELLLLSDRISAQDCVRLGMINKACTSEEFEADIQKWLSKLTRLPATSSSNLKQLIYQSHHLSFESQCELEANSFIESVQTKDFAEGVQAFMEKRAAKFGGNV